MHDFICRECGKHVAADTTSVNCPICNQPMTAVMTMADLKAVAISAGMPPYNLAPRTEVPIAQPLALEQAKPTLVGADVS